MHIYIDDIPTFFYVLVSHLLLSVPLTLFANINERLTIRLNKSRDEDSLDFDSLKFSTRHKLKLKLLLKYKMTKRLFGGFDEAKGSDVWKLDILERKCSA